MWLVEAMGVDAFRAAIEERMGQTLRREVGLGGRGLPRAQSAATLRGSAPCPGGQPSALQ